MPILLPETLPATAALRAEGIRVLAPGERPARTLEIGLVNLMPDKPTTETQLGRLLGAAPQVTRLSLYRPEGEASRRTPAAHLDHYETIEDAAAAALDALIITGAPVEQKPFSAVRYWPALAALYDHARERALPTLNICWAAMAALHHFRGVAKRGLARKAFGVFDQRVLEPSHPLMQGIAKSFPLPVSRHADVPRKMIEEAGVSVLAADSESGASVAHDAGNGATLLFDHFEYDAETLLAEFLRDRQAALPTAPPSGLALGSAGAVPWRPVAHLLFRNWLTEVERGAAARRPRDLLDWLLASDAPMPADNTLVAVGSAGPELFAGVAAAAAALGMPVASMRHQVVDGTHAVAVALRGEVAEATIERFTKRVVETDGVHRVLHRAAGHHGSALVAQPTGRAA